MLVRNFAPEIIEALSDTPVVMLNGARQTGKSTLAKSLFIPPRIAATIIHCFA